MRINTNRGLICKRPKSLLEKGKLAVFKMSQEKWFSICLPPKHLPNIYDTYVRSLVLYGSELLNRQERRPLEAFEDELVRTYLKGFLKLKSTNIAKKHTKRLMLILRIPTTGMDMDRRCLARVEEWSMRSVEESSKSQLHANQSISDIKSLQDDHPPRIALRKFETGETARDPRRRQWSQL